MSVVPADQGRRLLGITLVAALLALASAGATLERSHYQDTHVDTGADSIVTTSSPAPAEQAIYPSGLPSELTQGGPAAGGVSLSSTPVEAGASPASTAFQNTVVVAQVHALTAIAAVKACAARHGLTADCTQAKAGSLGTDTGLTIVHGAPKTGEVRVIRAGSVYSATAAAARGYWYAVTVNNQTGAESRICLSHHGKQACPSPNW